MKQIIALREFSSHTAWHCLLRLDDDALIIGPAPHLDALTAFEAEADVGMLGAYLRRGDGTDKSDAMKLKSQNISEQIRRAKADGDIELADYVTKITTAIVSNGCVPGYMCTGGAFFLAKPSFETFGVDANHEHPLSRSFLDDDLLFAMHVFAGNFKIQDFSDREHVMAINWRGLPMPLEDLVLLEKKIVHPVKESGNRNHEKNIRLFFRERRKYCI